RMKVVVADYDYGDVDIERKIVEGAGMELVAAQSKSERDVIAAARDADAILNQYATVGAQAIEALPELKVISRYGTGVDIVDVDAATRKGIQVTNAPNDWCADEVADHAVALLMSLIRKIHVYDRDTRRGLWHWQSGRPIYRIRGSVLGLLSFGVIAQRVAARMAAFGAIVHAHDPFMTDADIRDGGAEPVSFDELVTGSDYLVIQAPLTEQTRGLFGEEQLRKMKPTAFLVNTARGPIISDRALYRALSEGWIAGAGLDDLEEEPAKAVGWKPENPLLKLDNVLITPHAAYYSEQSIRLVREIAANEAVRVLRRQPPLYPVNRVFESYATATGSA
ncbi:MAG TPA: C-terminal binding protein, partial [Kofleriaceae bacterium]|nr:C-terminal binding protein [Kofleriaceae bacterium]